MEQDHWEKDRRKEKVPDKPADKAADKAADRAADKPAAAVRVPDSQEWEEAAWEAGALAHKANACARNVEQRRRIPVGPPASNRYVPSAGQRW